MDDVNVPIKNEAAMKSFTILLFAGIFILLPMQYLYSQPQLSISPTMIIGRKDSMLILRLGFIQIE
jgi:hypothetical protein